MPNPGLNWIATLSKRARNPVRFFFLWNGAGFETDTPSLVEAARLALAKTRRSAGLQPAVIAARTTPPDGTRGSTLWSRMKMKHHPPADSNGRAVCLSHGELVDCL
jgi:hypothetical protein